MSKSQIETELLEATGLKPKKHEDRQDYLSRLCRAGAKVPDPIWEGLSTDTQNWNNDAAQALKDGTDILDFPDLEEDEEELVDEEVDEKPVAAKPNGKKVDKEPKNIPMQSNRKASACHTIKKIVAKNPTITVAELSDQLKGQGLKVSDVTIATLRSDFRDSLRVLNEIGIGKFSL